MRTADGGCGNVSGYAQSLGEKPADRVTLDGSTFGAARVPVDGPLPEPVGACPGG